MTAARSSVTLAGRIRRSDDVLFQDVGGEAVLLDLASELYFGLNPVGTRIWNLIDGQTPLGDILVVICTEYDADPTRIRKDLLVLVEALSPGWPCAGLLKC